MVLVSQQGDPGSIDFRNAAVNKALGSVSEFVDVGHEVVFDGNRSYSENSKGKQTKLRRQNGVWYLDCWKYHTRYQVTQVSSIGFFKGKAEINTPTTWRYCPHRQSQHDES